MINMYLYRNKATTELTKVVKLTADTDYDELMKTKWLKSYVLSAGYLGLFVNIGKFISLDDVVESDFIFPYLLRIITIIDDRPMYVILDKDEQNAIGVVSKEFLCKFYTKVSIMAKKKKEKVEETKSMKNYVQEVISDLTNNYGCKIYPCKTTIIELYRIMGEVEYSNKFEVSKKINHELSFSTYTTAITIHQLYNVIKINEYIRISKLVKELRDLCPLGGRYSRYIEFLPRLCFSSRIVTIPTTRLPLPTFNKSLTPLNLIRPIRVSDTIGILKSNTNIIDLAKDQLINAQLNASKGADYCFDNLDTSKLYSYRLVSEKVRPLTNENESVVVKEKRIDAPLLQLKDDSIPNPKDIKDIYIESLIADISDHITEAATRKNTPTVKFTYYASGTKIPDAVIALFDNKGYAITYEKYAECLDDHIYDISIKEEE